MTATTRRRTAIASTIWLAAACGAGVLVPPTFILVAAAMLPTLSARLVDRTRHRALTIMVGALNFAGAAPFLVNLWRHDDTISGAFQLLRSPWTWLVMYGGAGAGWVLHMALPPIVGAVLAQAIDHREAGFVGQQKKLREDWGDEVAGE